MFAEYHTLTEFGWSWLNTENVIDFLTYSNQVLSEPFWHRHLCLSMQQALRVHTCIHVLQSQDECSAGTMRLKSDYVFRSPS